MATAVDWLADWLALLPPLLAEALDPPLLAEALDPSYLLDLRAACRQATARDHTRSHAQQR